MFIVTSFSSFPLVKHKTLILFLHFIQRITTKGGYSTRVGKQLVLRLLNIKTFIEVKVAGKSVFFLLKLLKFKIVVQTH